jgi:hypothetical protein
MGGWGGGGWTLQNPSATFPHTSQHLPSNFAPVCTVQTHTPTFSHTFNIHRDGVFPMSNPEREGKGTLEHWPRPAMCALNHDVWLRNKCYILAAGDSCPQLSSTFQGSRCGQPFEPSIKVQIMPPPPISLAKLGKTCRASSLAFGLCGLILAKCIGTLLSPIHIPCTFMCTCMNALI